MESATFADIDRLNAELAGNPFKLAVVDASKIDFLEKNARYMRNETFRNLVENIRKDGGLSSVPFCWKNGDRFLVLSGNHRVRAALEAGVRKILVMFTDRDLTRGERIAIQLSHNAIEGEDDPVILKELWDEIEDVNLKFYAGLDDKLLGELSKVTIPPLSEVNLDFRSLTFVFLPKEVERLQSVFRIALETVGTEDWYLAHFNDFDRLLDAMAKTQASHNIRNGATALMLILDVFERHLTDLAEGWEHAEESASRAWIPWISLSTILGTDKVPFQAAQIIRRAVEKMLSEGSVGKKNLWQCLEFWAADHLAGKWTVAT